MSARTSTLLSRGRREEVAALQPLPSPRGVALELMQLAQRENVSIAEVARLAQSDPALAGRLIKAANAPALGLRRPTASVQEAILRLGLPVVRQLAVAFSLAADFRSGRCGAFDYDRFWTVSLLRALAAQVLAARLRLATPEEAFCCGLLGQVGRLGLATAYAARYAEVLKSCGEQEEEPLRAAERAAFALDHAELSGALLEDWGFPPPLLRAVAAHFQVPEPQREEDSREARLARLLDLAHTLACAAVAGGERKDALSTAAMLAAARLGLDAEALRAASEEVARQAADWSALLGVRAPEAALLRADRIEAPAGPAAAGTGNDSRLGVLVVDDDKATLLLARKILEQAGYRVWTASNGREALAEAARSAPHLVITDWVMPAMDGIALTRALRASAAGQQLYILVLTGLQEQERVVEALDAGADDLVAKPYVPRVLLARLRAGERVVRKQAELERALEAMRGLATELAENNRRLERIALTDALTGLPNRRYALERLEQECAAARRRRSPLACLVVDVDHFKRVNDERGHAAGDAVLKQVASAMRAAARLQDAVCRFGGEEFVVIAPDSSEREALTLAERLRKAVAPATVSIGVASDPAGECCAPELLRRADDAMYAAKRAGRDCVRAAGVVRALP
jgi:diguanylate cyclase (GGDEF)-like protein